MKQLITITVLACTVLLATCAGERDNITSQADFDRLLSWMTGSFSSQHQAESDSTYFDIRLEMVQIWKERTDGYWLYVEQAVAQALDKPYRQRVYHLMRPDDSTFASEVYTFEEPSRLAGAWQEPTRFDSLSPDVISLREGCTITLLKDGPEAFVGSTHGIDCISTLRGAAYATSEVRITATELYSWDRGFDTLDLQVWGAEIGGYVFRKVQRPQ